MAELATEQCGDTASKKKMKRPKAAGEGESSERGKPKNTIKQQFEKRAHQRRAENMAVDHGFSPPKESFADTNIDIHGFSPPKRHSTAEGDRKLQPEKEQQNDRLRVIRKMHLDLTSAILCMSVLGVKQDSFLELLPKKFTLENMKSTLIELGELEFSNDAFLNAIVSSFELTPEGFMGAMCVLKSVHLKDAAEVFVALFDSNFDGKVSKKDLVNQFNSAIPPELNADQVKVAFSMSKRKCKEMMNEFDKDGKGYLTYQDIVVGLKEDPKRISLLSMNLVREKKWQRTSICAPRGPKSDSLLTYLKNKKREAKKRKKDLKDRAAQHNANEKGSNAAESGNLGTTDLQEERRKARLKQQAEMKQKIENQRKNLKAAKLSGKANSTIQQDFTLVVKDQHKGGKKEISITADSVTMDCQGGAATAKKLSLPKDEILSADEDIVEDEVEDAAMETLYGLDDVSYEESVEEDFLNESITEEIMASSIGSSLECSSPQKQ